MHDVSMPLNVKYLCLNESRICCQVINIYSIMIFIVLVCQIFKQCYAKMAHTYCTEYLKLIVVKMQKETQLSRGG